MTQTSPIPERRPKNAELTKAGILATAVAEFADKGFDGTRVDDIAARTGANKRMIYYYFESKEKLYVAVLEHVYSEIREAESRLELDHLSPQEAIRKLIEFTLDFHVAHPYFSRLVSTENIQQARYLSQSKVIREVNSAIIDTVARVLARGVAEGVFRPGIDPVDLHMMITALCFFSFSNRYSFKAIFDYDMLSKKKLRSFRELFSEVILRFVAR